MRILMVCLGNICRSPLAEGILQQDANKAGLDWVVDSAGTNGYHIGEPPHPLSQKVAGQHGIDISGQRARKFLAADFQRFDRIYAMAEDVLNEMRRIAGKQFDPAKTALLLDEVWPGSGRDVPDPWSGPEKEYHEAFERIGKACTRIVERLGAAQTKTS
jgi:protein-tyrosine phosphatase